MTGQVLHPNRGTIVMARFKLRLAAKLVLNSAWTQVAARRQK
jgi:hypothetical protein